MKKILVMVIGCFILSMNVNAENKEYCIELIDTVGDACGSDDSVSIEVVNNCSEAVYVKMCIEKTDGSWSCGSNASLEPGSSDTGFFTCHGTGEYRWSSCTGGYSECGFSPNE